MNVAESGSLSETNRRLRAPMRLVAASVPSLSLFSSTVHFAMAWLHAVEAATVGATTSRMVLHARAGHDRVR